MSLRFRQLSGGAARRAERSCASGASRLTGADGAEGGLVGLTVLREGGRGSYSLSSEWTGI